MKRSSAPEGVLVSAGIVAAGLFVELLLALVVLDYVERRAFLDVHALVSAGDNLVAGDQVEVALVGAVGDPCAHAIGPLRKK